MHRQNDSFEIDICLQISCSLKVDAGMRHSRKSDTETQI